MAGAVGFEPTKKMSESKSDAFDQLRHAPMFTCYINDSNSFFQVVIEI